MLTQIYHKHLPMNSDLFLLNQFNKIKESFKLIGRILYLTKKVFML